MKLLLILVLGLTSTLIGQTRTVQRQEAIIAKAQWVDIKEDSPTGEVFFVDKNTIEKEAIFASFEIKMVSNGVILYRTVHINCITQEYIQVNYFGQSSEGAKLFRFQNYDMLEIEDIVEDSPLERIGKYACKHGKVKASDK